MTNNRQILRYIVRLPEKTYKVDLASAVKINPSQLPKELAEQPGKFAWFSVLAALARDERDKAETRMKLISAEVEMGLRSDDTRRTEAHLRAEILISQRYQDAVAFFHQMKRQHDLLVAAKESMEQRAEQLRSLNANMGAERRNV